MKAYYPRQRNSWEPDAHQMLDYHELLKRKFPSFPIPYGELLKPTNTPRETEGGRGAIAVPVPGTDHPRPAEASNIVKIERTGTG